MAQFSIA
jgi:hypothetical protein